MAQIQLHRLQPAAADEAVRQATAWAERQTRRDGAVWSSRILVGANDRTLLLVLVERDADDRALPDFADRPSTGGSLTTWENDRLTLDGYDDTPAHETSAIPIHRVERPDVVAAIASVAFLRVGQEKAEEFELVERAYLTGPVGDLAGFAGSVLYHDHNDPGWYVGLSAWRDRAAWFDALAEHAAMLDAMVVLADELRVFEFETVWEYRRLAG